jgi:hypothetical protein
MLKQIDRLNTLPLLACQFLTKSDGLRTGAIARIEGRTSPLISEAGGPCQYILLNDLVQPLRLLKHGTVG